MSEADQDTVVRIVAAPAKPEAGHLARIELDNGMSFVINRSNLPLTIGRGSSCDLTIPSGHVSRNHCELFLDKGVLQLKDSSSNGTLVDNRLIKKQVVPLKHRAFVSLAEEVLITITPLEEDNTQERRVRPDRRDDERRSMGDRRQEQQLVDFERRWGDCRRVGDRRFEERR